MRALAARLYEVLDERGPPWASVAIDYVEDPEALATLRATFSASR